MRIGTRGIRVAGLTGVLLLSLLQSHLASAGTSTFPYDPATDVYTYRYSDVTGNGTTEANPVATPSTGAVSVNVSASQNGILPVGHVAYSVGLGGSQARAWGRVTKKIAGTGAGTVQVNFRDIIASSSISGTPIPSVAYAPTGYVSKVSSVVQVDAYWYYYPCAITVNCGYTQWSGASQYLHYNGVSRISGSTHTLNLPGVPGTTAGASHIKVVAGVLGDATVWGGPTQAAANASATVSSIVTP